MAEVARELGVLSVAVVLNRLALKKETTVQSKVSELASHVDSLITIPNEKLLSVLGQNTSILEAYSAANDVLLGLFKV